MGIVGTVVRLSLFVAMVSIMMTFLSMERYRDRLQRLLGTCPMHWTLSDIIGSDASESDGIVRMGPNDALLSKEELALYHGGEGSKGLYIAILGRVYDVETGRKHYGPGGGYSFFAGMINVQGS